MIADSSKYQVVILIVLVLLIQLPAKAEPPAGEPSPTSILNLIVNPNFEDADNGNDNTPAGVAACHAGKSGKAKLTWEEPGFKSRKCLAVETLDSDDLGYWLAVVPVKPLTTYTVSFYYKCRSADAPVTDDPYAHGRPGGPNLELGAEPIPGRVSEKTKEWSDTEIALGPLGGTYLPPATGWSIYKQNVVTLAGQTRMLVKLRLYGYIQKAYFDNLSVVETATLPKIKVDVFPPTRKSKPGTSVFKYTGPSDISEYDIECSSSPAFSDGMTLSSKSSQSISNRKGSKEITLPQGRWFWHAGIRVESGLTHWLAEGQFYVGKREWTQGDTTPPVVNLQEPVPGATVSENATLSATFTDVGTGIDFTSAKILLDGLNVTSKCRINRNGFILKPVVPLGKGVHRAVVSVRDKAGNISNKLRWSFGVNAKRILDVKVQNGKVLVDQDCQVTHLPGVEHSNIKRKMTNTSYTALVPIARMTVVNLLPIHQI